MRHLDPPPSPVVVGIDGSRAAVCAALWAVDEAVSRDVPLRLVCAIAPVAGDTDPQHGARNLATAELAVRYAFIAVESTDEPVKIEVEIVQGSPTRVLVDASRTATMLCVGAIGVNHFTQGRVGSTAAAVATSARCPVAIVRDGRSRSSSQPGCVLAQVDETFDSVALLQRAVDEALLRRTSLRVLTTWQTRFSDLHDSRAVAEGNRCTQAHLDRLLERWRRCYPDLDLQPVTVHGNIVDYLAQHGSSVQLVVVGSRPGADPGDDLFGPAGYAALHDIDCSILVCERRQSL